MDEATRARAGRGSSPRTRARPTRPGRRTLDWRKLKLVKRQELVIGGFTEAEGHALALRRAAGRAADPERQAALRRARRRRLHGEGAGARRAPAGGAQGRDLAVRRAAAGGRGKPHFVRPELVAEVKFAEWTSEGYLRQPVYLGLRDDLVARVAERRGEAADRSGRGAPAATRPARALGAPELRKIAAAFEALVPRGSGKLEVPGAVLELGNLGKPLWPELGLTKGDLFRYYLAVAPYLLPVVRDRPLVMKRFPDGIAGSAFYQQRAPEPVPRGVRSERVDIGDDVPARLVGGRSGDAAPHGAAGGDLPGPVVLARAVAVRDGLRGDRSRSDGRGAVLARARRRPLGARRARRAAASRAGSRPRARAGCTSSCRCARAPRTSRGCCSARSSPRSWSHKHPEAATVERTVEQARSQDGLHRLPAEHLGQDAGLRLQRARQRLRRRLDAARAGTSSDDGSSIRAPSPSRRCPARLAEVGDLWAGLREAPGIDLDAALERAQARHTVSRARDRSLGGQPW